MRKAKEIYSDAQQIMFDSGNQSLENTALIGIHKAQKDMFYFLYERSELPENYNLSLTEFFDKMDRELIFDAEL